MAIKRNFKKESVALKVEDSTFEEKPKEAAVDGDCVRVACRLPFGIKFDDVPNGQGGTKTIILPSVDERLRGAADGILTTDGAVMVKIPRADWNAILEKHGKEAAFVGVNGGQPCIRAFDSDADYKSAKSELKEMRHGLEPADPKKLNVQEES